MLASVSRSVTRAVGAVAPAAAAAGGSFPSRGMAESLADLRKKIRATANVAKLTGVMKLVASSKLKKAEEDLEAARPFGRSLLDSLSVDDEGLKALVTEEDGSIRPYRQLIVPLTTDRGLCGSVNSTLSRGMKPYILDQTSNGVDVSLFVLGEKGRAQIGKEFPELTVAGVDSCFDKEPMFALSAALGEMIVSEEFDVLTLVFNEYFNASKFETVRRHFPQLAGLPVGQMPTAFEGYTVEPENNEETLVNLMEFGVASSLFYAQMESQACEISQRVTAMDNASTNANDMVDRYTLTYNRARQAKITTELTEIISGAESLEEGD